MDYIIFGCEWRWKRIAKEKQFENKIKKFLKDEGCWFVKYFANRMTRSGVPDILACVNGYFIAIEVKAENGRPSELQKWNVEKIRDSGGIAIILYPNQFEEFKTLVTNLKKKCCENSWIDQFYFDR